MPTPEDRSFFEGLNQDLAKSLNVAIAKGFKGASISLDAETVKLIGVEMGKSLKPLTDDAKDNDADGGGGGGSGSSGEGNAYKKVLVAAKAVFNAARQLVAQNASNVLAFGDTMARGVAATNNMQLMRGKNLTTQFGKFGFNIRDVGEKLDSAMRANVKGLGTNTQNFIARTTGLGTSLASTNKFLASNTNTLGRSMDQTIALGTDIQNAALSNGMMADAMFEAVAAFEANTKKQQVLFGDDIAVDFQEIIGHMEGLGTGADFGSVIAKASPTDRDGLMNLNRLGGRDNGGFSSRTIRDDPARHTAKVFMALNKFGKQLQGMDPLAAAQHMEAILKPLGFDLSDVQKAMTAVSAAGGSEQGLVDAMKGKGPVFSNKIQTDEALQNRVTENSLEAANNLKNFAVEVNALDTVQWGLAKISSILKDSFYDLNDGTTLLAETMGLAAAGEAAIQSGDKMGLGGIATAIGAGITGLWTLFQAKKQVDRFTKPRTPSSPTPRPSPTPPGGTSPTPRPSPTPGGTGVPRVPGGSVHPQWSHLPGGTNPTLRPFGTPPPIPSQVTHSPPLAQRGLQGAKNIFSATVSKIKSIKLPSFKGLFDTTISKIRSIKLPDLSKVPHTPGRVPLTPTPYSQWQRSPSLSPSIPRVPYKPFTGTVTSNPALGDRAVARAKTAIDAAKKSSIVTNALNSTKTVVDSAKKSSVVTRALDVTKGVAKSPVLKATGTLVGKLATPLAAVTSGYSEYQENEDKSRAAAAAVGAGGGAWGGATAGGAAGSAIGATIGAFFFGAGAVPGAAIGGVIGAISGGIAGLFAGEKIATTVHDQFDPEVVAKMDAKAESNKAVEDKEKNIVSKDYQDRVLKQMEEDKQSLRDLVEQATITNEILTETRNPDGSTTYTKHTKGRIPGYFERNNLENPFLQGGALGAYNDTAAAQRGN